jgi:hypothetical protein
LRQSDHRGHRHDLVEVGGFPFIRCGGEEEVRKVDKNLPALRLLFHGLQQADCGPAYLFPHHLAHCVSARVPVAAMYG